MCPVLMLKPLFCAFKVKPVLINKVTIKPVLILYPYIIQIVINRAICQCVNDEGVDVLHFPFYFFCRREAIYHNSVSTVLPLPCRPIPFRDSLKRY